MLRIPNIGNFNFYSKVLKVRVEKNCLKTIFLLLLILNYHLKLILHSNNFKQRKLMVLYFFFQPKCESFFFEIRKINMAISKVIKMLPFPKPFPIKKIFHGHIPQPRSTDLREAASKTFAKTIAQSREATGKSSKSLPLTHSRKVLLSRNGFSGGESRRKVNFELLLSSLQIKVPRRTF